MRPLRKRWRPQIRKRRLQFNRDAKRVFERSGARYKDTTMATDLSIAPDETGIGEINKYDFVTPTHGVFRARRGLNAEIVSEISEMKAEPRWMRDFRLDSLKVFDSKPMPR